MDTSEILTQAIHLKKSISFEYEAADRVAGIRYGNPHVLFKSPFGSTNVDVFKTGGVSTEPLKPIPAWRVYKLENIRDVKILNDLPNFETAPGYNPKSKQYNKLIAAI